MNQSPMLPPIRTKSQKIKKMLRTTSESALPQIPETRAIRQITPKLPPIKSEGTPTMAAMGGIDIISSNSVGTTVDTRLLTHSLSDSLLRTNADVSAKLHLLRNYSQRERKRKWTSCINHVQQVRNVEKLSKTLGKSISSGLLEMSRVISHAHEQREHAVQQRSLSWMSDSIDATKMDRRMSDAELNDLQSKRSLQSTAKHFRKVNEYLSHCRRLDNRLELKANVVKIRKERRRKIGGRLIVSNNIIRAGDRALAQCDHQQWLHKQRKWKTRSKRNREKLQRSTTRSRRRSAMECKKHQKMADLQRQKSISKRALQSKVQRRWLSLITVTLPRIVRLIELHQNEQDVKDYLDQRREASIKIQRWFRERVEVRNAKHHSHLAFMLLRTESQRQFNVGMNRSADIIKHFLHILISSNPTHYQMRKQSYHFKQQVIRLQRWWRGELEKKRQIKLQIERQWHGQEKLLKKYADHDGEYFHSVPKAVRKKVVSDLIERHRRSKRYEYRQYLHEFAEHRKKSKFNIKWVMIKRSMGVPAVENEYVHLFAHNIKKPVLEFVITTKQIRKLIQRTSAKQMLYDMQRLLGTNSGDCQLVA